MIVVLRMEGMTRTVLLPLPPPTVTTTEDLGVGPVLLAELLLLLMDMDTARLPTVATIEVPLLVLGVTIEVHLLARRIHPPAMKPMVVLLPTTMVVLLLLSIAGESLMIVVAPIHRHPRRLARDHLRTTSTKADRHPLLMLTSEVMAMGLLLHPFEVETTIGALLLRTSPLRT